MPISVTAKEEILVGRETVIGGPSPQGRFIAVFEDDGETGYFYALDKQAVGNSIQDALHIYNVMNVTDRARPSVVSIGWSQDGSKAVLLINEYPHAVFDFSARQGRCRTGFPPVASNAAWSGGGHAWDDAVIALFA